MRCGRCGRCGRDACAHSVRPACLALCWGVHVSTAVARRPTVAASRGPCCPHALRLPRLSASATLRLPCNQCTRGTALVLQMGVKLLLSRKDPLRCQLDKHGNPKKRSTDDEEAGVSRATLGCGAPLLQAAGARPRRRGARGQTARGRALRQLGTDGPARKRGRGQAGERIVLRAWVAGHSQLFPTPGCQCATERSSAPGCHGGWARLA